MNHRYYMEAALAEAEKARIIGEVPVGAVIVLGDSIIARAYNQKEILQDPTAHAEMLAIREATKNIKAWRLTGATLYVTLEPCCMCAGAIIHARIDTVVFGASDLKGGACGTCFNLLQESLLNHQVEVIAGVMEEECKQILKGFFRQLRQ
ncbi:MAG: tRNA adenosine(34) deaminase TadA [Clostridia bacterium]|nr:tRNA adenosine(34) deaminase TadA [Clostridia bacterium]